MQQYKQQILFIKELEKIIGRNRFTLRRWWNAGKFPVPTKLNGNALAWPARTIELWIEQNMNISNHFQEIPMQSTNIESGLQ